MSDAPRPVWRDPSLPHQIVIRLGGRGCRDIEVSCNCLGVRSLAHRRRWDDPEEPMRVWREHMEHNAELSKISECFSRPRYDVPTQAPPSPHWGAACVTLSFR